jgi:hypothetical protein
MSITYLTIKGKTDGFGSQYQAILSGISYSNYKKYIYFHTPFTNMEHNTDIRKANEFIGINTNSMLHDISCNIIERTFISEVHYSKSPSIYYTDEILEYIRKYYYSSEKPVIGSVDIAIHIRRGDVRKDRNVNRYISNDVYIKIINKLKEKYPGYIITIFSEGEFKDFKEYDLEENCFRLNTDIFETFHSLVSSKVLITSCSSFSYCAGIINSNTVYHYDSFWHKKLNNWLKISDLIGTLNV